MIVVGHRGRATTMGGGAAAGAWSPKARRKKTGSRHRMRAEINVTPLVDVVLVLLIIFMVVTPMLNKGVNVDLPLTEHHDKRNDDNRDIVVAITRTGELYVGSDRVALDVLGAAVLRERGRHPTKPIFLKGDTRISYGEARRAMQALHAVGVDQVQLGTEEARRP